GIRSADSRAEHRLVLREDNTVDRLADIAIKAGLVESESVSVLEDLKLRRISTLARLNSERIFPTADSQSILKELNSTSLLKPVSMAELLRRPEIGSHDLKRFGFEMDQDPNISEPVEIEIKYAGYIKRQLDLIAQSKKQEELLLPTSLVYSDVRGLSREECDKLNKVRPRTLGQAQRISGVNPSAIQAIMIYLKGRHLPKESELVRNTGRSPQ
ncbi:MAG: tRNA uridine-5-carboxymethylaminomethyl(34) synthesis enzyme MnmG, partial [Proteobacteria bacterium]